MSAEFISSMNLNKICSSVLILLAFTIPISTAAIYITLGLFLLFWILDNFKNPLKQLSVLVRSNPVAMAGCIFFLIHIAGLCYTPANQEKILEGIQNGGKLLFMAMAMIYLKEEKKARTVLLSFIGAMGIVLALSYLIRINMVPGFIPVRGNPANCFVFHDHIKHNTLMAFTVFAAALFAGSAKTHKARILWAGFSFLGFINIILMVHGRTGHLIMFILLAYYFFSWDRKKSVAALLITFLCVGLLMLIYPSNPLLTRARTAVNEVKAWNYGEPASSDSSSGLRLEFYANSLRLIKEKPFIGTGTGSFETTYSQLIKGTRFNPSDNPHNEFLMTGVQLGLVGILILLSFFIAQWRHAASFPTKEKRMLARGLVLTILTSAMVGSPIQDSAEGWFFALISAALFAPQKQKAT